MSEGPLVAIVDDDKSIRNATQDYSGRRVSPPPRSKTPGVSSARRVASARLAWSPTCECEDDRLKLYRSSSLGPHHSHRHYHGPPGRPNEARAREAGITCYLIKPFAPDELLECVRGALAKSQTRGAIPKS